MGIEWRWIASNFYVLNDEFIATTYDSRTMTDNYILELYNSHKMSRLVVNRIRVFKTVSTETKGIRFVRIYFKIKHRM